MEIVTINLSLENYSYPILIGEKLLSNERVFAEFIHSKQVLIVSNSVIAPLYLSSLSNTLENLDCSVGHYLIPDGEEYKNFATLNALYNELLTKKYDRSAILCALGGGIVGDLTGFAAATYRRGIAYIQLPTSLLAQVDASIGGKTAINHPLGKNMIGAFHHPKSVIIDINTLQTLPNREFSAGLAEIIKYGLIIDENFFCWLEKNIAALLQRDKAALQYAIIQSCKIKANIVSADEKEHGLRALLNLGHTFGHAIETATNYAELLHGEAVAIGTCMACELSKIAGMLNYNDQHRVVSLLNQAGLPVVKPAKVSTEQILERMLLDKKILNKRLRLVLLEKIGKAVVTEDYDHTALEKIFKKGNANDAKY